MSLASAVCWASRRSRAARTSYESSVPEQDRLLSSWAKLDLAREARAINELYCLENSAWLDWPDKIGGNLIGNPKRRRGAGGAAGTGGGGAWVAGAVLVSGRLVV